MRVSVIDLGFNSVKLVNYYVNHEGNYKAYQREGAKVRLGQGLGKTGALAQDSIERTIDVLRLFREIINFQSIEHILTVATSAVREAKNRDEFLKKVFQETRFRFRVLSDKEEALYSYLGALQSTCLPTALFFDLGGGSLELVYTENCKVKSFVSLPLGGLRLSQIYSDSDGTISKKNYFSMEAYLSEILPKRKGLGINLDATLVGVGGTLRAIARYDQERSKYPLNKIHNYRIDLDNISLISKLFLKMTPTEIAKIDAVGANRADTISAGSCVIKQLMQKLEFDNVVVSAQGLREGVLSAYLGSSSKRYLSIYEIDQKNVEDYIKERCKAELIPGFTSPLVKPLLSSGLLKNKEYAILTSALKQIAVLPPVFNLNTLFYLILDEDKAGLSHGEQLVLALSIIYMKKSKAATWFFRRYRSIMRPQNKKSIQKIAALLSLAEILERAKIRVRPVKVNHKEILLTMIPSKNTLPLKLIETAIKAIQEAFGIKVNYSVLATPKTLARNAVAIRT
jgi:exopolyphosphatase / guanosine-5'-triphosphate,3'-diphosphate pyrophosphatase